MAIRVAKQPRLPSAYQEVEYIQSTGTQYIDTGVNAESGCEIDVDFVWNGSATECSLLGVKSEALNQRLYFLYQYPANKWTYGYGNYYETNKTLTLNTRYHLQSKLSNGQQYLKNISTNEYIYQATLSGSYNLNLNFYWSAFRNENTVSPIASKLYSLKFLNDETLVRDYVPCYRKSDSAIGLYDLVNGNFVTNPSGTGTFLMGRPINALPQGYQEVEYIQSSGTQYIDTGIIGNGKIRFDVKFNTQSLLTLSGFGSIFSCRKNINNTQYTLNTYPNTESGSFHYFNDAVSAAAGISVNTDQHIGFVDNLFTRNDGSSTSLSVNTNDISLNIYLSARNYNGNADEYGKSKFYNVVFYELSTMIRNYIPCYRLTDGEIGMYDIVNGQFYGNSGTGVFTAGANVGYYHNINPVMFGSADNANFNQIVPNALKSGQSGNTDTRTNFNCYVWLVTSGGGVASQIIYQGWLYSPNYVDGIFTSNSSNQRFTFKHNGSSSDIWLTSYNSNLQVIHQHKYYYYINFTSVSPSTTNGIKYNNFSLVDLTQMFGAGNEPSSINNGKINWIRNYLLSHPDYNTGEIISFTYAEDINKVVLGTADGIGKELYNKPTRYYLYNRGDEYTSRTGGLSNNNLRYASWTLYGTLTKGSNSITIDIPQSRSNPAVYQGIITQYKINTKNYNKLKMNVTSVNVTSALSMGITTNLDYDQKLAGANTNSTGVLELDISNYHNMDVWVSVIIVAGNYSYYGYGTFDKLWLEE